LSKPDIYDLGCPIDFLCAEAPLKGLLPLSTEAVVETVPEFIYWTALAGKKSC